MKPARDFSRAPAVTLTDGSTTTAPEVARRAGISIQAARTRIRDGIRDPDDLFAPAHSNGGQRVRPVAPAIVDAVTPYADDVAAQLFVDSFPNGATLDAVGQAMGLSRERVRQIESRALRKLRNAAAVQGVDLDDLLAGTPEHAPVGMARLVASLGSRR